MSPSSRNAPSPGSADAPDFRSDVTPEQGTRPLRGGTGACRSELNSANLISTPRAKEGGPSLPLNASRPHIPKQSTSLLAAAAVAATRARPPPRRLRTPASPGRGAEPAANGVAAAQYRGAAQRTQSPPPRTGGAQGPGVGCARRPPPARAARHTTPAPQSPQSAPPLPAPPHSGTLTRPPPQPTPPRAQPLPCAPLLSPGAGSSPAYPSPEPLSSPTPLTAAQRPAASAGEGGRRPGARKRPDRRDPGRTPYLGGRRGGDRRSGSASERGGRQ